jgi:hypothetical protein
MTSRMKHWKGPEGKIRIKYPDTRQQLHFKIKRTSERIDRKLFILEFMKGATGVFSRMWKVSD